MFAAGGTGAIDRAFQTDFRAMLKAMQSPRPDADSKTLYEPFPVEPAKQGAEVAGLPQALSKGAY